RDSTGSDGVRIGSHLTARRRACNTTSFTMIDNLLFLTDAQPCAARRYVLRYITHHIIPIEARVLCAVAAQRRRALIMLVTISKLQYAREARNLREPW